MANPNPNKEGLKLGRGKRPKENNETLTMRIPSETRKVLDHIAEQYGCIYGNKPWIAGLLRMIGSGELMIVVTPPTHQGVNSRGLSKVTQKNS
jgi:hypothetical protein